MRRLAYIIPCHCRQVQQRVRLNAYNVCPAGTYSASGNATCTQCPEARTKISQAKRSACHAFQEDTAGDSAETPSASPAPRDFSQMRPDEPPALGAKWGGPRQQMSRPHATRTLQGRSMDGGVTSVHFAREVRHLSARARLVPTQIALDPPSACCAFQANTRCQTAPLHVWTARPGLQRRTRLPAHAMHVAWAPTPPAAPRHARPVPRGRRARKPPNVSKPASAMPTFTGAQASAKPAQPTRAQPAVPPPLPTAPATQASTAAPETVSRVPPGQPATA